MKLIYHNNILIDIENRLKSFEILRNELNALKNLDKSNDTIIISPDFVKSTNLEPNGVSLELTDFVPVTTTPSQIIKTETDIINLSDYNPEYNPENPSIVGRVQSFLNLFVN